MFLALCVFYLKLRILHPGDNRCSMQLYYCKQLILLIPRWERSVPQNYDLACYKISILQSTYFSFFSICGNHYQNWSDVSQYQFAEVTWDEKGTNWKVELRWNKVNRNKLNKQEVWQPSHNPSKLSHFEDNFVFSPITCELMKTTCFFFIAKHRVVQLSVKNKKNKQKKLQTGCLKLSNELGHVIH